MEIKSLMILSVSLILCKICVIGNCENKVMKKHCAELVQNRKKICSSKIFIFLVQISMCKYPSEQFSSCASFLMCKHPFAQISVGISPVCISPLRRSPVTNFLPKNWKIIFFEKPFWYHLESGSHRGQLVACW